MQMPQIWAVSLSLKLTEYGIKKVYPKIEDKSDP